MRITEKMLRAYFIAVENLKQDPVMVASAHYFHRTKKFAFSVKAERLNEKGLLPGEAEFQDKHAGRYRISDSGISK